MLNDHKKTKIGPLLSTVNRSPRKTMAEITEVVALLQSSAGLGGERGG
jgi:hypothetical protein